MDSAKLNSELKKNILTPLYLFIAKDTYIANSYINLIKQKIEGDFKELNIYDFEAKYVDPSEVISVCYTLPVMAQKRLVVIRDKNITTYSELCDILISYAQDCSETTTLIVKTDSIKKNSRLYKAFDQYGKIVTCDKMKRDQLSKWIQNRFAKYGFKIERDALIALMESGDYFDKDSEIDLGFYVNEIDKLVQYHDKKQTIVLDTVDKVSSNNIDKDIFRLIDDLFSGNLNSAYEQMYHLTYNKVVPQIIIASIARNARNICICQSLSAEGKSEASIAKQCSIHPYAVKKAIAIGKRFSVLDAKNALLVLNQIDVKLKTGLLGSEEALALLIEDIGTKKFLLARGVE